MNPYKAILEVSNDLRAIEFMKTIHTYYYCDREATPQSTYECFAQEVAKAKFSEVARFKKLKKYFTIMIYIFTFLSADRLLAALQVIPLTDRYYYYYYHQHYL